MQFFWKERGACAGLRSARPWRVGVESREMRERGLQGIRVRCRRNKTRSYVEGSLGYGIVRMALGVLRTILGKRTENGGRWRQSRARRALSSSRPLPLSFIPFPRSPPSGGTDASFSSSHSLHNRFIYENLRRKTAHVMLLDVHDRLAALID